MAEDCGTDRHAVVNQAVYEFARRFNFLTPLAKEVPAPEVHVGPGREAPPASAQSPVRAGDRASERRTAQPQPQQPQPQARPLDKPKRTLYVVNGAGESHKIEKDTFIIGRSRTCDLVIPSSKVSRQHTGVCRENGEYFIEDLGSANGVWKDGVKISKEKISDGDEYMVSEELLRFVYR
jgi:pSer/pThr/pTyr-binding forkhead associated (FHA) protein